MLRGTLVSYIIQYILINYVEKKILKKYIIYIPGSFICLESSSLTAIIQYIYKRLRGVGNGIE